MARSGGGDGGFGGGGGSSAYADAGGGGGYSGGGRSASNKFYKSVKMSSLFLIKMTNKSTGISKVNFLWSIPRQFHDLRFIHVEFTCYFSLRFHTVLCNI